MAVSNWSIDVAIVAGADLSAKQYQPVNLSGVLATAATNVFGILQDKPKAGDHASVRRMGFTKLYMSCSLGEGAYFQQSNTTSGVIALVGSGYPAFGQIVTAAASGSYGTAWLFGGPLYTALS